MRKRIIIGLLAIVVIGVAAYVLSQPKRGSVEWHKREYRAARNQMYGVSWSTPIKRLWYDIINKRQKPEALSSAEVQTLEARQAAARKALTDMGYLVERRFTVSNHSASSIIEPVMIGSRDIIPQETRYFTRVLLAASNVIVLAGAPQDMDKWEELIRKADMPESGK